MEGTIGKIWRSGIGKKVIELHRTGDADLRLEIEKELSKITVYLMLDVDSAADDLWSLYKRYGQKPKDPVCMVRSFLVHLFFAPGVGVARWVDLLNTRVLYRTLCGFERGEEPAVGTHYGFMDRLVDAGGDPGENGVKPSRRIKALRKAKRSLNARLSPKERREARKARAKGEPVTALLREELDAVRDAPPTDDFRFALAKLLQRIAVKTSLDLGMLSESVILCGDGSSLPTGAASGGRKDCECGERTRCECSRFYSDPHAQWGYDSTKGEFFFGHRFYQFTASVKTAGGGHDLPLAVGVGPGDESDFTLVLKEFELFRKTLNKLKLGYAIEKVVLDAGHDGGDIHRFFRDRDVNPFIDIKNSAQAVTTSTGCQIIVNERGVPVCPRGAEMRKHCSDKSRSAIVFACPAKRPTHKNGKYVYTFRPELCPVGADCAPSSSIGPFVCVKTEDDPRLFPQAPRNTREYKTIMAMRTGVERSNGLKKGFFEIVRRFRTQAYFHISLTFISILEHAIAWRSEIKALGIDLKAMILDREELIPDSA